MKMPESKMPESLAPIPGAIVRRPGQNIGSLPGAPDPLRAAVQFRDYCEALEKCGVAVTALEADETFPAGCLVNNMAVVTEYLAVIANFADSHPRQGEQQEIAARLGKSKFLKFVTAPGRLDARDVLNIQDHFYVTPSSQTN